MRPGLTLFVGTMTPLACAGWLGGRWTRRGTRPSAPHDQRTASTYIFGAICPGEGKGAALVLPACNTEAMNLHLAEIATEVAPGKHAVLVLDQAGWHLSARLAVPGNVTLIVLPPKCPELNPAENVWQTVCSCRSGGGSSRAMRRTRVAPDGPAPSLTQRGRAMHQDSAVFVGLDASKLKISVALAEDGRQGEVRFLDDIEHTPRQLMAYVGLVPSERSTGEQVRRGSITKAGNPRARRVLIEGPGRIAIRLA